MRLEYNGVHRKLGFIIQHSGGYDKGYHIEKIAKELKRAIRDYSHKTNFYKLGLIRKFILKQEKEREEIIKSIPKVTCPNCGSKKINIKHDDREYSSDSWLYCDECDELFDDDFDYIDAVESVKYINWDDEILIRLCFGEPDIRTGEWKQFCEKEIKKYLGIIKEDKFGEW